MTNILILEGHEYIVDPGRGTQGSEPDEDGNKYDEWRRKNAHAMLIFDLNTLGDANAIVLQGSIAKEVWETLKEAFGDGDGKAEE